MQSGQEGQVANHLRWNWKITLVPGAASAANKKAAPSLSTAALQVQEAPFPSFNCRTTGLAGFNHYPCWLLRIATASSCEIHGPMDLLVLLSIFYITHIPRHRVLANSSASPARNLVKRCRNKCQNKSTFVSTGNQVLRKALVSHFSQPKGSCESSARLGHGCNFCQDQSVTTADDF